MQDNKRYQSQNCLQNSGNIMIVDHQSEAVNIFQAENDCLNFEFSSILLTERNLKNINHSSDKSLIDICKNSREKAADKPISHVRSNESNNQQLTINQTVELDKFILQPYNGQDDNIFDKSEDSKTDDVIGNFTKNNNTEEEKMIRFQSSKDYIKHSESQCVAQVDRI